MKTINVVETAEELLTCNLPKEATLVFDNDYGHVFLQNAGNFDLSDGVTVDQVISALAANAGLFVHIT